MFIRPRRPLASVPANLALALAALAQLALLAFALTACTRERAEAPATAANSSTAGRLLGVGPSSLMRPSFGRPAGLTGLGRVEYPLAVGNRWNYTIHTRSTIVAPSGPQEPSDYDYPWTAEITDTQHLGTRDYFLQAEFNPIEVGPNPGPRSGFRMRQDQSGLFELDSPVFSAAVRSDEAGSEPLAATLSAYVDRTFTDITQRAAFERAALRLARQVRMLRRDALGAAPAAPGGPDPFEISLLRYPLFMGAQWIVRDSPRFARTVVARERVTLPAGSFSAWRLRNTSELFGPNDRVWLWYASAGLVRLTAHLETQATDESGNPIGLLRYDSDQQLVRVHLVDPHAPHAFAVAPAPPDGLE